MDERKPGNLFNPQCPSRALLELISGKWSLLLICALYDGRTRNGELMRKIDGISQKMLTQALRELESIGIVRRISHHEVPPRVEYELTELGRSLGEVVRDLENWIVQHYEVMNWIQTQREANALEARSPSQS